MSVTATILIDLVKVGKNLAKVVTKMLNSVPVTFLYMEDKMNLEYRQFSFLELDYDIWKVGEVPAPLLWSQARNIETIFLK